MIIEDILGNVSQMDTENKEIYWLAMPFDHAHKKIQRFLSEDKRDFALRLSEEARQRGLKNGDIIHMEEDKIYAIAIEEEECLLIRAENETDMAPLAYVIGNRHARLYYGDNPLSLLTPYEKTMEDMLGEIKNIRMEKVMAKLDPEKSLMAILPTKLAGHDHDHDHDHGHDHSHD